VGLQEGHGCPFLLHQKWGIFRAIHGFVQGLAAHATPQRQVPATVPRLSEIAAKVKTLIAGSIIEATPKRPAQGRKNSAEEPITARIIRHGRKP
jgi:hypothetical protein